MTAERVLAYLPHPTRRGSSGLRRQIYALICCWRFYLLGRERSPRLHEGDVVLALRMPIDAKNLDASPLGGKAFRSRAENPAAVVPTVNRGA